MSKFKQENRYVVLKTTDIDGTLTSYEKNTLKAICLHIEARRKHAGKSVLECVVVESDWPIYEQTWDEVQRLVEGRASKTEDQQKEIAALKNDVDMLPKKRHPSLKSLAGSISEYLGNNTIDDVHYKCAEKLMNEFSICRTEESTAELATK